MVEAAHHQQSGREAIRAFFRQLQGLPVVRLRLGKLALDAINRGHGPRPFLHFGIIPGRGVCDNLEDSQAHRRRQVVTVFGKVIKISQRIQRHHQAWMVRSHRLFAGRNRGFESLFGQIGFVFGLIYSRQINHVGGEAQVRRTEFAGGFQRVQTVLFGEGIVLLMQRRRRAFHLLIP